LQLDSDSCQIQQFLSPFLQKGLSSKTLRQRFSSKPKNLTKHFKKKYCSIEKFSLPVKKKITKSQLCLNPPIDEKYYVFNQLNEITRKRLSLWKSFPERASSDQHTTTEMCLLPETNVTHHHFLRYIYRI
jgi:hypothetical protein